MLSILWKLAGLGDASPKEWHGRGERQLPRRNWAAKRGRGSLQSSERPRDRGISYLLRGVGFGPIEATTTQQLHPTSLRGPRVERILSWIAEGGRAAAQPTTKENAVSSRSACRGWVAPCRDRAHGRHRAGWLWFRDPRGGAFRFLPTRTLRDCLG